MRQGFADAIMVAERHKDVVALVTFKANHHNADTVIVSLGGESVIE